MKIIRLYIGIVLGLSLMAPNAWAYDNSSLAECHATSLRGNVLGPEIAIAADGQLVADPTKLVLHGTAAVGLVCFSGTGEVTAVKMTQNIAGLCVIPLNLSVDPISSYTVNEDGTGSATVQTTVPADATLPPGCALLGAQPGDQARYDFNFVLRDDGCMKVVVTNLVGPQGAVPIVTEGGSCPQ